jgi:hypothetical protein
MGLPVIREACFLFKLLLPANKSSMLIDIIGWIGSVMVVMAYGLNIYKKLASDTVVYFLLNIAGSGCLIANTLYHRAIPSAVVNAIWVLIALVALLKRDKEAIKKEAVATGHKN